MRVCELKFKSLLGRRQDQPLRFLVRLPLGPFASLRVSIRLRFLSRQPRSPSSKDMECSAHVSVSLLLAVLTAGHVQADVTSFASLVALILLIYRIDSCAAAATLG